MAGADVPGVAAALGAMNAARVPWWMKIAAKIVLSRLPVSYERWRSVGVFRHGAMRNRDYAIDVFYRHYRRARPFLPQYYSVLELGPGDSLATAVIAAAHGASKIYLVDTGRFAIGTDIATYNALADRLGELGHPAPGAPYRTVDTMLSATRAVYLTDGIRSLESLPDASVDLVFSQAVLEHVGLSEFDATIRGLYRLQKPGSVGSHRVDLQDHLSHSLHSLRFSQAVWESRLLSSSGFYTNRLRASQVVGVFEDAGYEIVNSAADRWPQLPLPAAKMHPDFARLSEDDLRVSGIDIVARRAPR